MPTRKGRLLGNVFQLCLYVLRRQEESHPEITVALFPSRQVSVLSWFFFLLEKHPCLFLHFWLNCFYLFLNLKNYTWMLFKKKNQRYFSKFSGQFSVPILFRVLHLPWSIRGRPGWVGAGYGEGTGDMVKDASRSLLSKGLGLFPNVSFGVISLKSILSTCVRAPWGQDSRCTALSWGPGAQQILIIHRYLPLSRELPARCPRGHGVPLTTNTRGSSTHCDDFLQ